MDTESAAPPRPQQKLWLAGAKALAAAVVGTLVVRWLGVTALEIPPEFPPLAVPGPTIFFTAVAAVGATAVYAVLRRVAERPAYVFRWIAAVVLLVSFAPDAWLLTGGAAESFPGATPAAVGTLMLQHVVAAGAIVWGLTGATE